MPVLFSLPKENLSSLVGEILANREGKSSEEVHRLLSDRAAEFIQSSPKDALRYAGNRVLWNKQPLFHAVLFEQFVRQEVSGIQKEKLYCHTVYCYALAGELARAAQCAEQSIQEGLNLYFLAQVENAGNQTQLPIFCAIFYMALVKRIETDEENARSRTVLIDLYQKAAYFYAMAQQIPQAKQCVKQWSTLSEDMRPLLIEASNSLNNEKNPLYCGIIYHQKVNKLLNSSDDDANLREDLTQVATFYAFTMRCYSRSRQIELLKSAVYAFKFIDGDGSLLYGNLLKENSTRQEHPLLTAVFHEVYNNFRLAAQHFRLAGYSSEESRCLQLDIGFRGDDSPEPTHPRMN